MKRKVPVRLLCFLLAGIMTVTSVQMPVYAAEAGTGQEAGTGEGERESEVRTEAEEAPEESVIETVEAAKASEETGTETEEADGSADLIPDSTPGDTEMEDAADPVISDAVVPEPVEPEKTAVPEGPVGSGEVVDADAVGRPEITEATDITETEEEEETPVSGETPDNADGDPTTPTTYEITGQPRERIYLDTESFERTGVTITEKPSNRQINIDDATVEGFTLGQKGEQTVKISYGGASKEFKVLVISAPKLSANFGDTLSNEMLTAVPSYGGSWAWVNAGQKLNQAGSHSYMVNYTPPADYPRGRGNIEATVDVTCDLTRSDVKVKLDGADLSHDESNDTYSTTYDGTKKRPTVTVSVNGVLLAKDTDFTVEYGDNTNAGTGTVTVEGKTGSGCTGKIVKQFTIEKAKLTIRAVDQTIYFKTKDDGTIYIIKNGDTVKRYDATNTANTTPDFDYRVSGLADADRDNTTGKGNPDRINIKVQYTCNYNLTRPAPYTIHPHSAEITGSASGNYLLGDNIEYTDGRLTVSPYQAVSVKISGVPSESTKEYDERKWPYGANAGLVFGNGNAVPDITVKAAYSGTLRDGTPYPESKSSEAPADAGRYTVTFELEEETDHKDELYTLETATYTFTITPKVLTITAGSYHVAAGEEVPEVDEDKDKNELIKKLLEKDKKYYTVEGFLDQDKNNQAKQDLILDTSKLTLRYGEDSISAKKSGTFDIIPYGYELGSKDKDGKDTNIYTNNYEINPVNGKLTVEGRKQFDYDFTSITVSDMTYNSKPHSISGYAAGLETYKIVITGEARKEGYTNIDEDWDEDDEPKDNRKNNYKRKSVKVLAANIVEEYEKIAPTEVGDYTVRIFSEINQDIYEYDGEALVDSDFQILPLKKYQMKLVGVTGMTNKDYNGEITDLSEQIKNARIWTTEQDIDITDLLKGGPDEDIDKDRLKFSIREVLPVGETGAVLNGYGEQAFDWRDPDKSNMPVNAGAYELVVKVEEDSSQNYVASEWAIPFTIRKRPLTVTVVDKKIPVNPDGDGTLPADLEYEYIITDETITDETKKVLDNKDFEKLLIEPAGEVDTRMTGSYDLNVSSELCSKGGEDKYNYDVDYVPGKLFIQTRLLGVKELDLTNNKNIPHGKTLKEIAAGYLPKTVAIYLDGGKNSEGTEIIIEDTADITWDTERPASGAYNINSKAAQSFQMRGAVVLPDMVYIDREDKDKGWLTVTVDVSVREENDGTQAKKPVADVRSGTVGEGTKVNLSTDEEGAQIYYTIEADNPSLSVTSRRYAGPIEIKCTMIIRAVSRVYGKLDSEELYLYYYYNKNLKPDDPDDPDNPDNPNNPQVPDEDIPKDEDGNPLDIPKGMWVTDVAQYTYSGTAIKPAVRVYDYRTRLEENKDYTISYKNNVNAADKNNPRKAPTVVVKGKGNYEGKIDKTFTIAPKNINDVHDENGRSVYDVKMDDITVPFVADKAQKPAVAVSWNGKKLANKKDFTFEDTPYTEVGTYPVKVTGNGNYTGERKISFVITNFVPATSFTVNKIADYNYTGQEIRPTVVVTYQKKVLQPGVEYTVSYEDNKEIGTASAVIKGAGRFAGVKRVNFKIKAAASLNKAQVEFVFGSGANVYTGQEIRPSQIKMAVQVENNGAVETRVLTENDYKVSYQNNVKAGTATAIFEGVGAYSGILKKTFKIARYNLQNIQPDQITVQASYPYMKGGSRQKPAVLFDGKALQEGTDYTLSYRNNNKVGSTAVMTIKGKGNFTGSVVRTYQVTVRDISNMTVTAADKVYQSKTRNYTTRVRVTDSNGELLEAGKDYDKYVDYSYAERITTAFGEVKNAGDPVASYEIVPVGAKIRVTVTAIGKNFQGTAIGTFSMVQGDVAKAKVTVPVMTYTGKAVEPKQSEITVVLNGVPLSASDYRIVGYSNNLNQGTAKLTIQGLGSYGGTKTVNFKIKRKSLITQLFG